MAGVGWWLLALSLVLSVALLVGYERLGRWSSWAILNKWGGWFALVAYFLAGTVIVRSGGIELRAAFLRIFFLVAAATALLNDARQAEQLHATAREAHAVAELEGRIAQSRRLLAIEKKDRAERESEPALLRTAWRLNLQRRALAQPQHAAVGELNGRPALAENASSPQPSLRRSSLGSFSLACRSSHSHRRL